MANLSISDSDYKIRHSASHVLAQAVLALFPDAELGTGPATEDGFYYDFRLPRAITPEDLPELEKKMKHILKQKQEFTHEDLSIPEAKKKLEGMGQPLKIELIEKWEQAGTIQNDSVSFHSNGPFTDLCEGGHVRHTGEIGAVKLTHFSAAYWQGDEARGIQMQRIYGVAFATQAELEEWQRLREEAKKRDHRVLGAQLELFTVVDEVGAGLPIYLPRGAKLRQVLERYMTQEAEAVGYQYVYTPHIAKSDLFARSGHLSHYRDGMYAPISMVNLKGEGAEAGKPAEQFYLKPMNCPMHHQVYLHRPRSYRDLPYRVMEYGTVYRYEESGVLAGLIRVRGFTQNDAHVYCARSQLFEVISEAVGRFLRAYEVLGIRDYKLRFSLPDFQNNKEKYGEETQEWRDAIAAMRTVLDTLGVDYYDGVNEAAFYGPKIDFQVRNVNGKEDTLSTIQVDFSIAEKFGITYTDSDGSDQIPAIIHMALMGSIDRFMAFLIEMNAGRFPFWVAPEQVRVLTVTDAAEPYAREVAAVLRDTVLMQPLRYNELRFTTDARSESLGKKIRQAETDKIPVMLIVGEKDAAARQVSVRSRDHETAIALDDLRAYLQSIVK